MAAANGDEVGVGDGFTVAEGLRDAGVVGKDSWVEELMSFVETVSDGGIRERDPIGDEGELFRGSAGIGTGESGRRAEEREGGGVVEGDEGGFDVEIAGERGSPVSGVVEEEPVRRGGVEEGREGVLERVEGFAEQWAEMVGREVESGGGVGREVVDGRERERDEGDERGEVGRETREAVEVLGSGEEGDVMAMLS